MTYNVTYTVTSHLSQVLNVTYNVTYNVTSHLSQARQRGGPLVWVNDVWVSVGWLWDSVCWEWVGVVRCELVVGQCWLVNMYNHNF